jgi:hypothetical protein
MLIDDDVSCTSDSVQFDPRLNPNETFPRVISFANAKKIELIQHHDQHVRRRLEEVEVVAHADQDVPRSSAKHQSANSTRTARRIR